VSLYSNYRSSLKRFRCILRYRLYLDECFVVTEDLYLISVSNSEDENEAEIRFCTRYSEHRIFIVATRFQ
jgi:hypothetical protein